MRYEVDLRVGMVAVRDTAHPDYRKTGCLSGDQAIVKSWHGRQYKTNRPDGKVWYVPTAKVMAAGRLCAKLNAAAERRSPKR